MRHALFALVLFASALPAAVTAQSPERDRLLVSAEWLQEALEQRAGDGGVAEVVVLHVGEAFAEGHIPGARPIRLDQISVSGGERGKPGYHRLDLPEDLTPVRAAFEAAGVSDDSRVVVAFEGRSAPYATRVLWTLQVLGLGERSSLLDGGLDAWEAAGGPVATGEVEAGLPAGRITARSRLDRRVEQPFVASAGGTPGVALVDARRPASYDGSREELPGRTGHIPGAGHLFALDLYTEEGRLRPEAELRDLFARAGVEEGDQVVAYCHIGLWATSVVLAARTLGYDAVLYDGSMTEWAADDALPLAVPDAPDPQNR